jgi:hypothetical protein
MSTPGHKQSSQNLKAQLANAYNELGKELAASTIRVIGNYTLGKAIGEGTLYIEPTTLISKLVPSRCIWQGQIRNTPLDLYTSRH